MATPTNGSPTKSRNSLLYAASALPPSSGSKPNNEVDQKQKSSAAIPSNPSVSIRIGEPDSAQAANVPVIISPSTPLGRSITVNPNWDFVKNIASLGIFTFLFLPATYCVTLIVLAATVKVFGDKYFEGGSAEAYQILSHPAFKRLTDIATLGAGILVMLPSSLSLPFIVGGILAHKQLIIDEHGKCCCQCHTTEGGTNPQLSSVSKRNWTLIVYGSVSVSGYAAVHAIYNAVIASFSATALFYAIFYALLSQEAYALAKKVEYFRLGRGINERDMDKQLFQALSQPILNALGECFEMVRKKLAEGNATPQITVNVSNEGSRDRSNGSIELSAVGGSNK